MVSSDTFTLFEGHTAHHNGDLFAVAGKAVDLTAAGAHGLLILDDQTGQPVELDLRHSADLAVSAYRQRMTAQPPPEPPEPRPGRGRPRLGVVAREVTLLPRHWDWLAGQPGGASAVLRRLVEEARREAAQPDRRRKHQETLYRAMSVLAGDLPGFDEAARALFADDMDAFQSRTEAWPVDVAAYLRRLVEAPQD
ncbi:DUF2239 family protein [Phenylobacterium sp.]|jgi:hypothetical protein|uniref:DUF2239 family protein n=1 Tax=Phenylobacterium sp. TaxID=1871053 RepID=UPI0037C52192